MSFIEVEEDILKELVINQCQFSCIRFATHLDCDSCRVNDLRKIYKNSFCAIREYHRLDNNIRYLTEKIENMVENGSSVEETRDIETKINKLGTQADKIENRLRVLLEEGQAHYSKKVDNILLKDLLR